MTTYEITTDRWSAYMSEDDGLDAIASLGVEPERFTANGLLRDDGTIEPYEDFHVRVCNIDRDGGNAFDL